MIVIIATTSIACLMGASMLYAQRKHKQSVVREFIKSFENQSYEVRNGKRSFQDEVETLSIFFPYKRSEMVLEVSLMGEMVDGFTWRDGSGAMVKPTRKIRAAIEPTVGEIVTMHKLQSQLDDNILF